jgi:hypothetical protein
VLEDLVVKKRLIIIPLAIMFAVFFSIPAYAEPTVSLDLLDNDILVGESFGVQVTVDGDEIGQELIAFGFDVFTTGDVFSYDGYVIESGFDDDSSGSNNVAGSSFLGNPNDDILLATLSFTGLAEGAGSLSIEGNVDPSGLSFLGLFYPSGEFNISDTIDINVAPVPVPGTMVLLGTGLFGLAGFGRKKKTRKN